MNVEAINKYVRMLVGNLTFSMDYNQLVNGSKRLLIVEGQTDKKFIEKILNEDVVCLVANKAFGAQKGFGESSFNCKCAIMQVVYGMSKLPITFLNNVPKEFEACTIFGMIDLDYDETSKEYLATPRLFVTDTHDLETLLLSTDNGLLQRIDGCVIPSDDSKKAFYLAYQLGFIRKVIMDVNKEDISLKAISGGGSEDVDYAAFIEGNEINVRSLIHYINVQNDNVLSAPKEKKLTDSVISNKKLKKKLDANGTWNARLESFDASNYPDFWEIVNGHDILSLLRYVNMDAADKYANRGAFSLNRNFEVDLIENYQYSSLDGTQIYKNMKNQKVVKDLPQ